MVHFVRTVNAEAHYLNPFISHRGFMMCKTNLRQSILIHSVDFNVKDLGKIFFFQKVLLIKKKKKSKFTYRAVSYQQKSPKKNNNCVLLGVL